MGLLAGEAEGWRAKDDEEGKRDVALWDDAIARPGRGTQADVSPTRSRQPVNNIDTN